MQKEETLHVMDNAHTHTYKHVYMGDIVYLLF